MQANLCGAIQTNIASARIFSVCLGDRGFCWDEEHFCEMMINPESMKRLPRAFTDYHKKVMTVYAEAGASASFTSDDLGRKDSSSSHERCS